MAQYEPPVRFACLRGVMKSSLGVYDYRGFYLCWSLRSESSHSTDPPPPAAQIAATPGAAGGHVPCSCRILSLAAGGCVDMTSYSTPFPMQHERTPKTDQRIPNYGHCSASTRGECMHMSELEVTILDLQRAPYGAEACCRVV